MSPTARMPYSDPSATPCTSSGIEYGKKTRRSTRHPTDASASRPACAPRPGLSQKARARSTKSVIGVARSRTACGRQGGAAGRRWQLAEVVAGPDLHVRPGLAVVRRRLVLVEVDDARVLHPDPVTGRDLQERPAAVAAADGRKADRRGL